MFSGASIRQWGGRLFAALLLCSVWMLPSGAAGAVTTDSAVSTPALTSVTDTAVADTAVPATTDAAGVAGRDRVAHAWWQLLAVSADPVAFGLRLDELLIERDLQGLTNLESAAIALAQMAAGRLSAGDAPGARRFGAAAVAVAPVRPEGYLAQSAAYWAERDIVSALTRVFKAASVGMQHYWVGVAWLSYLVIICWLSAATTFVVMLVPSLVKGLRSVQHFFREISFFRAPTWITAAGAGAVAVLPLAAGLGPGWVALTWTALAWLGDDARQRRVQLLLLLLVLMGPWLCAPFLSVREPLTGQVGAALSEGRGAFLPGEFQARADCDPQSTGDWRVAFALGNTDLRDGRYERALNWYQRAKTLGGDPVRIGNNIATAHYRAGRTERAEALYASLTQSRSAPVLSLLNLGQVQSQRLDFEAARQTLDRAREADPERYLKVMQAGSERSATVVIPYALSRGDSRAILLSQQHGWDLFATALWRVLFGAVPVFFAPLILFVVATLFWVLPRLLRGRRISECGICRTTTCPSCLLFVADLHLCRPCGERMADSQGAEVAVRQARDRFATSGNRLGAWLARWIPGLVALGTGRYGAAGFHLFAGAFLVWWLALLGTIPEWALGVPQHGWPVARAVVLAVLGLYVAWSFLSSAGSAELSRYAASSKRGDAWR